MSNSNERKEYYTKQWGHTGYTNEEAKEKCTKVREALLNGGKTAYTSVEIEADPRGGYRIVATYKTGIHYYDNRGNIEYTTPIR